jgi:hypothetical protein
MAIPTPAAAQNDFPQFPPQNDPWRLKGAFLAEKRWHFWLFFYFLFRRVSIFDYVFDGRRSVAELTKSV